MQISALYTYPIKSIRPCSLEEAELTRHGFRYDRRFMLLQKISGADEVQYKNMQVAHYPEMVLFHPSIHFPQQEDGFDGTITIHFCPPHAQEKEITVPLRPDINNLETTTVDMYTSSSEAYIMPTVYNDWFSTCFGYPVVLVYLGPGLRPVLMSTSSSRTQPTSSTWLGGLASWAGLSRNSESSEHITFADCAPYLVVSERSMDDIHHRLPTDERMDITKFRPNIIVSGADEPWEEDYWAELLIAGDTKLDCAHNCGRCQSINIDFATGKPGTSEAGKMLSKLQRDRRVDPGMKYSPVFGRYAFLPSISEGHIVRVGDHVTITRRNAERTIFDWKGLCTLPQ